MVLGAAPPVPTGAQEPEAPRLRLSGVMPGGLRGTMTDGWGRLDFQITNLTDTDRQARVLAFFANQPDVQFGRELWVPANATVTSWLPLGPATAQAATSGRELQLLLQELSEGKDRLLLPQTEERVRGIAVAYRKREPATVLVVDADPQEGPRYGQLPAPDSPAEEAYTLARAFRVVRGFSEMVHVHDVGPLPPWSRTFDSVDHVILASNQLRHDQAGMRALRQWVELGGQVWVMLDQVDLETIAPLLGDALDFSIAGRVRLTDFRIDEADVRPEFALSVPQRHEQPVDFVRVVLPAHEPMRRLIDGWPLWFSRSVGRGTVLFTTLGPRGWYRPRTAQDPAPPGALPPSFPLPDATLLLATEPLHTRSVEPTPNDVFQGMLAQEIGYRVVGRGTVLGIFAGFVAVVLVISAWVRQSRRPELRGWAAPGMALAVTVAFLALGLLARSAAPPTVAVAQVVHAVAGNDEAAVHGLLAVYRPDAGSLDVGATHGGFFELDMAGIEGQTRRLIMTDMDAWRWDNLSVPAGVRFAPFQFNARAAAPVSAVASFGPEGLSGRIVASEFANLADAVITIPGARDTALRTTPDGAFSAASADALAREQFLAGALLNDRQQRRQDIYRRLLQRSGPESLDATPILMAWADPAPMPFQIGKDTRLVGTALLAMPLRLEPSPAGSRVTVPGVFVTVRRFTEGRLGRMVRSSGQASDQHLRFQVPRAVLPLAVDEVRVKARIDARSRRVTIAGQADGKFVELFRVEHPLRTIEFSVADERFLQLDSQGGLHFNVVFSEALESSADPQAKAAAPNWTIDYIELEVVGRTLGTTK